MFRVKLIIRVGDVLRKETWIFNSAFDEGGPASKSQREMHVL